MLNRFFKLTERKTNVKTEVIAGLATFLSMSYILFVNPDILSAAGMEENAVFVATALAAVVGCLIMGLYANFPVAQAPGMGMNAFFAFTICSQATGYGFQEALFIVFCAGVVFIVLAATGLREIIINAIPASLKYAVSAGIGLFIAFVGLKGAGIIVANEATLVGVGDFGNPSTLLAIFGIILTLILLARKVKAAIFIGLVVTAFMGLITGVLNSPDGIIAPVPSLEPVFGQLFNVNFAELFSSPQFYFFVFSVLFLDFFDTAGTLMGVATRAGLLDDKGKLIGGNKALMSDATATTVGAIIGTSSVTSYAESVVGVETGGRTGLVAVVVAIAFIASMFFSPLLGMITSAVTAPALVSVGALMMQSTKHVDFDDFADTTAAFLTMIFMILAYSIAEGIAVGFLVYVILKIFKGDYKKVHPIMYVLAILFVLYFISKTV